MCNMSVVEFFISALDPADLKGRRVLELGSKYVNGSVRPLIEKFCFPREYIGIDIEAGRFVDLILSAEDVVDYFGERSFDVVISTELLEHVKDWRVVFGNIKKVAKQDGVVLLTTRSKGFHLHGYPNDFWRYEPEDIRAIFADFEIVRLERDPTEPGVFLKARKPQDWKPAELSGIALYSMVLGKRTSAIPTVMDMPFNRKLAAATVCWIERHLAQVRRSRLLLASRSLDLDAV
jgi:SAM-dependent methyltransferase